MRSYWLHQISLITNRTYKDTVLLTVPQLREAYPNISAAYPKMGVIELEEIYERLKRGDEIEAPVKIPRKYIRKSKLSEEQIRELQSAGKSLREIAREAGVSAERIRQILI